jgi:response regulator RpfG family c-di-GMP phosphodiesterase
MDSLYIPNRKVLFVDDESSILSSFQSFMRRGGLIPFTLNDPMQIDAILEAEGPFAVVMSDQRMPGIDGVEVFSRVAHLHPETERIMVTGFSDYEDTVRAINEGQIRHFVKKPWDEQELRTLLDDSVQRYNLLQERRFLLDQVQEKNKELEELLEGTVAGTGRLLSDVIGYVNPHAAGQVQRVRRLGNAILTMIPDVAPEERWEVQRALDLFNLGLSFIPPWIQVTLNKDGLGSIDRFRVAQNHHLLTYGLLEKIPRFSGVAQSIRFMKKNFDGSGEPVEIQRKGEEIPLGARLLHILLNLERQSSEHFKGREVLRQMQRQSGRYDPKLLKIMLGERITHDRTSGETTISLVDLKPGMVLLESVMTPDGQLLIGAETVLTETSINILHHWSRKEKFDENIRVRLD